MSVPVRQHRVPRSALVIAALVCLGLLLPTVPAWAQTVETTTAIEAWYQAPLVGSDADAGECEPSLDCPPAVFPPAEPYPEDTLHVGNREGQTAAITAVTFDRSRLPRNADISDGTAFLPVADELSGTVSVEDARIVACLLLEPFEPADGAATSEAPAYDCEVRSIAFLESADGTRRFVVPLGPFLSSWNEGSVLGLALVPDEDDAESWHVAFSGRDREAEGAAEPITAEFTAAIEDAETQPAASDNETPPAGGETTGTRAEDPDDRTDSTSFEQPAFESAPVGPSRPTAAAPPQVAPPAVEEPAVDTTTQPSQVAAAQPSSGYAYPEAWLLPLLFAFLATSVGRALSREVAVLPADAPRRLPERLWVALWPEE